MPETAACDTRSFHSDCATRSAINFASHFLTTARWYQIARRVREQNHSVACCGAQRFANLLRSASEEPADESHRHLGDYLSAYERSKGKAREAARRWRDTGLPITITPPNGVVGANDHACFGYYLRRCLLYLLPRLAWHPSSALTFVEIGALARGICLAAERVQAAKTVCFAGNRQPFAKRFSYGPHSRAARSGKSGFPLRLRDPNWSLWRHCRGPCVCRSSCRGTSWTCKARAGTTLRRRPKQSLAGYTPRKNRCGIRSSNEKSNLSRDGRPFWIGCVTYRSFRTIKGRGTPFRDRRGG